MGAVQDSIAQIGRTISGGGSIQDIGAEVSRGARNTIGNTAVDVLTGGLLRHDSPNNPPAPPGMDPEILRQQQEQQRQAKEFEKNIPRMGEDIYGQVAKTERKNLAKQMSGVKSDASRRGILYSGIRQGSELEAQASSGSRLATARSGINRDLNNALQEMNDMAMRSGLNIQQQQQGIEDQIMGQALANMQNSLSAGSALGGAVGTIGGAYLGSKAGA